MTGIPWSDGAPIYRQLKERVVDRFHDPIARLVRLVRGR